MHRLNIMNQSVKAVAALALCAALVSCHTSNRTDADGNVGSTTTSGTLVSDTASAAPTTESKPPGTSSPITDAKPIAMPTVRACRNVEIWAFNTSDTVGVGVVLNADNRSGTVSTTYTLTASDFTAYRGTGLAQQFCSPSGTSQLQQLHVIAGTGTLILDPLGPIPMNGQLTTTDLRLSDGTTVAALHVKASCVRCLPS